MTLLLALPAFALDFPWVCPTFTEPADAAIYRDTDGGLADVYDRLEDAARSAYDPDCTWVETSTPTHFGTIVERVCEAAETTITITVTTWADSDGGTEESSETTTLTVDVPFGETWDRIEVSEQSYDMSSGSHTTGGAGSWSASWSGAFEGLPDDGWLAFSSGGASDSWGRSGYRSLETPGCDVFWWWEVGDGYEGERVTLNDQQARVDTLYDRACDEPRVLGYLDDVFVGSVDRFTWERDPADADLDGYVVPCDCDDADPAINPNALDTWDDGIDQDCDGADDTDQDVDDDGHDAEAFGGDDCDDADADVHAGAADRAGDGVDQDCDGADDVDADGDGYNADGDARVADCDDSDPEVRPGHVADECDGVDYNCDGDIDCPPDEDTAEDTAAAAPPSTRPPPSSKAAGCGGGAAVLAFLPLLGLRRRRA